MDVENKPGRCLSRVGRRFRTRFSRSHGRWFNLERSRRFRIRYYYPREATSNQPEYLKSAKAAYRAILEVLVNDVGRASRFLRHGSMVKAVLPDQNSAIAQQIGHELRILERSDRVRL